ncbi:hypothetical protein IAR55_003969 [Kwoniella newhampshirensis]|uniref:Uncharacterized protein n=1 Tax=Kwoniella newhampshirensis TaxID=1651941 RepID=A0AAW0YYK6_9TREE
MLTPPRPPRLIITPCTPLDSALYLHHLSTTSTREKDDGDDVVSFLSDSSPSEYHRESDRSYELSYTHTHQPIPQKRSRPKTHRSHSSFGSSSSSSSSSFLSPTHLAPPPMTFSPRSNCAKNKRPFVTLSLIVLSLLLVLSSGYISSDPGMSTRMLEMEQYQLERLSITLTERLGKIVTWRGNSKSKGKGLRASRMEEMGGEHIGAGGGRPESSDPKRSESGSEVERGRTPVVGTGAGILSQAEWERYQGQIRSVEVQIPTSTLGGDVWDF